MANDPNEGKRNPDKKSPGDAEETMLRPADADKAKPVSDESIDLGVSQPAGPGASGISDINWGSLADVSAPTTGKVSGIDFDSPSDADMLAHMKEPPAPSRKADDDSAIDLLAEPEPPVTLPPQKKSAVPPTALPPQQPEIPPAPDTQTTPRPSPLRNPTTLRSMAPQTVLGRPEPPAELVDDGSGVDLKALSMETQEVVVPELGGAPAEARLTGDSGIDLVEEQLLAEGGSGMLTDLGGSSPTGKDPPSGRDLIAEAVESGIDMAVADMEIVEEPAPSSSTTEENVDLDHRHEPDVVSSAVDLGGRGRPAHKEEELLAASSGLLAEPSSGSLNLEELRRSIGPTSGTAASAVDLGGHPHELKSPSASSSLRESGEVVSDSDANFSGIPADSGRGTSTVNANPDSMVRVANEPPREEELDLAATAMFEGHDQTEEVAEAGEEEEEKPKKKGKPAKKKGQADGEDEPVAAAPRKGRAGAWVGGTVLGTLVGAGACIGLSFMDINVPDLAHNYYLEATGQPVSKKEGTGSSAPGQQQASVMDLLRTGDFDKAAQAADDGKPETLAARGESRWLAYIKKQANARAEMKPGDEEVKNAMEDLQKADTPDAVFWLGQIQETTGDVAAARKTYSGAADKYKDNAKQARRFQAALNRLDLRVEKPAGPAGVSHAQPWRAEEALVAALLFTNLQDDAAKDDDKAKKDDDKGKKKEEPKDDDKAKKDDDKAKKKTEPKDDEKAKKEDDKGKKKEEPKDDDKAKKDDDKGKKKGEPKDDDKAKKDDDKGKKKEEPPREERPAPVAVTDEDEAGFEFWNAAKAARDQKYGQALEALEKARAIHNTRRFTQLRKPQNPLSDPTEEIFLKTCDELKTAWELRERLSKGGYLADNKNPVKAMEELIAKVKEVGEGTKAIAKKLTDDKVIEKPDELADGIDQLLKTRKGVLNLVKKLADEKIPVEKPEDLDKAVDGLLAGKKASDELAGKLVKAKIIDKPEEADKGVAALLAGKKTSDDLADKLVKEKIVDKADLVKAVDKLLADRKSDAFQIQDLTKTVGAASKIFDAVNNDLAAAKYRDPNGDVVKGVKNALRVATEKDPAGRIRGLETDVDVARTVLAVSRTPRDMLGVWLPQMQIGTAVADAAGIDADRVQRDPTSPADLKAQAASLKALIKWSKLDFAGAQPDLEKALAALPAGESGWRKKVEGALKDASNPSSYYLKKTKEAESRGNLAAAVGSATDALATLTDSGTAEKDLAPLQLDRARLLLDQARAKNKGRLVANDLAVAAARKDLLAAAKSGLPHAHYLLGQIAENLGQWNEAETAYRAAVKAAPRATGVGGTYRMALARVLLRDRQGRPAGGPPLPVGPKPKEEPKPEEKPADTNTSALPPMIGNDSLRTLIVLLAVSFQFQPQAPDPKQVEALKLADEILAAPTDQVPFEARAKALAIKGLWSRALHTYVEGLQNVLKREHAEGLLDLVNNHPVLKRPESLATPNGMESERLYASGLRAYFSRRFAKAEKDFEGAIEQDNQDARYYYFLGLARLAMNKRDAYEDFDQGAKLELQNRPGRVAVSHALERVQGPARKVVNKVRDSAR